MIFILRLVCCEAGYHLRQKHHTWALIHVLAALFLVPLTTDDLGGAVEDACHPHGRPGTISWLGFCLAGDWPLQPSKSETADERSLSLAFFSLYSSDFQNK